MQFESDCENNDANKNKNSSDAEREWTLGNLLAKTAKAPMTFLQIQLSHKIKKHMTFSEKKMFGRFWFAKMRECANYNEMDQRQWRKSGASVKKMLKVKRSDVWHS